MSNDIKCVVKLKNDDTELHIGTVLDFDPLKVQIEQENLSSRIVFESGIELIKYLRNNIFD